MSKILFTALLKYIFLTLFEYYTAKKVVIDVPIRPKRTRLTGLFLDYRDDKTYVPQIKVGRNLDQAIDKLAGLNRMFHNKQKNPIIELDTVADFEWYITNKDGPEALVEQLIMLDSLFTECLELIDGFAGDPYYRMNREFHDEIYPYLHTEQMRMRARFVTEEI